MKVIKFLNKAHDHNLLPYKIKYINEIWKWNFEENNYFNKKGEMLNWNYILFECLDEEIEILENQTIGIDEEEYAQLLKNKKKFWEK